MDDDVWSRYCSPIHVDAEELFEETADPDAASRSVVAQVEKQMMENTINAPEVRLPHINIASFKSSPTARPTPPFPEADLTIHATPSISGTTSMQTMAPGQRWRS